MDSNRFLSTNWRHDFQPTVIVQISLSDSDEDVNSDETVDSDEAVDLDASSPRKKKIRLTLLDDTDVEGPSTATTTKKRKIFPAAPKIKPILIRKGEIVRAVAFISTLQ